eukprot:3653052-Rhodomonas_salina.1
MPDDGRAEILRLPVRDGKIEDAKLPLSIDVHLPFLQMLSRRAVKPEHVKLLKIKYELAAFASSLENGPPRLTLSSWNEQDTMSPVPLELGHSDGHQLYTNGMGGNTHSP